MLAPPATENSASPPLTLHRFPLPALTGVRFCAAFYVVLFHGLPWLLHRGHVPQFLQTFLGNGYLAVALFFLLSGFILAYTYEGQISGSANRLRFWEARFARIYPVYFLSLMMCWWFERGLSFTTRIAVLGMVQAWNPRTPQISGAWNYPAWTLSVEAFFYLCFPFVLPWLSKRSQRFLSGTIGFLLALSVALHTPIIGLGNWDSSTLIGRFAPLPLLRIPEFLLGMALGVKFLRRDPSRAPTNRPFRVFPAVLAAFLLLSLPLGPWVSLVIVPFAVLVYELALGGSLLARLLSLRIAVLLGGASYAVYLLQFPVRDCTRLLFAHLPAGIAPLSAPLTPLLLVFFSIFVFKTYEEPARKNLRRWFAAARTRANDASSVNAAPRNR